jgi:hypothetical protein
MYRLLRIGVVSLFAFSVAASAANDPLYGTWKLNLAKSKYSSGARTPKSQTWTYEASGANGVKFTNDTVQADGNSTHEEYTAGYDGKEYPITGNRNADTVSMHRIDTNTTERTLKKDGKVTSTIRRVVSKDGKTLTVTSEGTNAQGQAVNNVTVFDKQ